MKMEAGRSWGRPRTNSSRADIPPAEAPITTMSRLLIDFATKRKQSTCLSNPTSLSTSSKAVPQNVHLTSKTFFLLKKPMFAASTAFVLVQPEMEKRRSPLVSIPPFGRGFSRHGVFRSDGGWAAQERALTPRFIVSMSPPGYPSAWLRLRSARFRFAGKIIVTPQQAVVSQHPVWP